MIMAANLLLIIETSYWKDPSIKGSSNYLQPYNP